MGIFHIVFKEFSSSCICWAKDEGNEEIKMSRLNFAICIQAALSRVFSFECTMNIIISDYY